MLSGRYPSDEFAELRPRVTWDRVNGTVAARQGAKHVAIANAGTIPDRGLYGVFLAGGDARRRARRRARRGDGVRGARRRDVPARRVDVAHRADHARPRRSCRRPRASPARCRSGRAKAPGRPIELGLAIGKLTRELRHGAAGGGARRGSSASTASTPSPPTTCSQYLDDQQRAAGVVPDDRTLVDRAHRSDELGDWRVSVLSPLGSRVHAPWAMAVTARLRDERGLDAEMMWGDDGFVVRLPEGETPPDPALLLPDPDEVEALVLRQLGSTALFAARFREAAGRALLLPRRRPGARAPLWQQRKRAADLLAVAARYGSFPMILETYRECLRDVFDLPALVDVLPRVRSRTRPRARPSTRGRRRRSRRRCSSTTSPTTSTTATRRWPSAAPRRCRSIRRSCASSSARPSCASCSIAEPWRRSSATPSSCPSDTTRARPTACTTCCCGSAI